MSSDNNKIKRKKEHSFWYYLYKSHLYPTKGEALFKACILSVSWVGGFWEDGSATAYYLFSIAIVMEYVIQLIMAEKLPSKVFPFILVVSNVFVFFASSGQLFFAETEILPFQYIVEIVTMIIIWVDTFAILMIEKPEECKIEDSLSRY